MIPRRSAEHRVPAHRRTRGTGRVLAILGVAVLGLAGCAGSSSGDASARPISEIVDGDITVTPDPTGTSATVEATTTLPVACAVVYGIDDDFGSIAVDDDMQGGAHADHMPRLVGLQPDTEYQYVLQGSDTSGAFYRSDVMTFRTPPAPPASTPGRNVASSATVSGASSVFSDAFAATNAIDGDLGTEWSTAGDGDDAWLEIDLGATTEIAGFAYRSREMTDGTAVVETFTVTVDGGQPLGPFAADGTPTEVAAEGRSVRIEADTTTGGNTGAVEIEVYAAP